VSISGQPRFQTTALSPEDVRLQLDRILGSADFQVPPRGREFLRYVVEETLGGRADRIKGYSVAIEVFGRDSTFTQEDPVVRIEAGRIRRALERYFLVAGQADPIRIEMPKGGYVPVFTAIPHIRKLPPAPPTVEPPQAPSSAPASSESGWFSIERAHWLATAVLALICLLFIFYWTFSSVGNPVSARPPLAAEPDGPTLIVAPFVDLGEGPDASLYAIGLTEQLLSSLSRFKEIKVFGRETSVSLPRQVDASQVRDLGARYLLTGTVQLADDRFRVTSRLMETAGGAILWSETYNEDLRTRGLFAIQSSIASELATVVAQPYGVIFRADLANPPPDDLDAYRCTLEFYAYRAELTVEQHEAVRLCLENTVSTYPSYGTAWSMLSIIYLDEDRFGFNPRSGSPTSLELTLKAAGRAVELDPRNVRALQSLMTALFFNNRLAESIEVGESALALNPNDTEFLGEFGTRLASGGQWQRGAAMLKEALARNPGASGYFHAMLALSAYMLEDDELALSEVRQANVSAFPLVHVIAAVIYAQNGLMDEATREGAIFVKLRPSFVPNVDAELRKRNFRDADIVRVKDGLRKAGLLPDDQEQKSKIP
jgi:TolB-like protein